METPRATPITLQAKGRKVTLAIALLLTLPSLAMAWGSQGHQTIALVAEGLMTPQAKRLVDELRGAPGWQTLKPGDSRYFRKADEDLTRFCQGPDGDLSLVADWADAWREHHPDTGRFHFVDTPLDSAGLRPDLERACKQGCILSQLDLVLWVLNDPKSGRLQRLEALLWVAHLVGDIHQPLHCADNGDRGGNAVAVRVLGRRGTLHWAWDTGFFHAEHVRPSELSADLLSHECLQIPANSTVDQESPWIWAQESFEVAKKFVYPQDEALGGDFDRDAVDQAWPVLRKQLAKAGVRLAATLNGVAR